ncbi:hypothetical protein [uncultured Arthrobacter sp.]|uniref:hypothetical protein n=1 Tax=uncultured Arthrobacter sp. TaxID=114050 RepID=UPI00263253D1|nr:hypothetical protein [uncultured Arthrobacter sp.]
MRIELQYTDGCPAAQPLRETAEQVLENLAPHEHIVFTRVPTAEGASKGIFPGSPMLLIDGREVGRSDTGQVYMSDLGLPDPTVPQEPEIRAALGQAAFNSPVRLPLRHRRTVLIASLLILFGALLGQLAAWGAVVTLAALALLAVGFASNGRRKGAQPYMWAAGFAALSWLLATAAIWWEVFFGYSLRLGATAGLLFRVGFISALVTVLSVIAGTVARHRLRQQLRQDPADQDQNQT